MKFLITGIFLFVFGLYLWTIAPEVTVNGDSGELIAAAYFWSIPHPPSYPLYTFIAHLFTHIPLGTVAWRVGLFAVVSHVMALIFLYKFITMITRNNYAAIGSILLLAFSTNFWQYSLIAEVFSLNNLMVAVLLYASVDFYLKPKVSKLALISLFVGLNFSNHHTFILVLPTVSLIIFDKLRIHSELYHSKNLLLYVLLLISGFFPYIFLLVRARMGVYPVAWSYPQSIGDVINLFLRTDYGTFAPSAGIEPSLATIAEKASQLVIYFRIILDDFGLASIVLALVGLSIGLLKRNKVLLYLLLGFLVSGPFFITYANFPVSELTMFGLSITERFYLLPNIIFTVFIGAGMAYSLESLKKTRLLKYVIIIFVIYFIFSRLENNYAIASQQANYLAINLVSSTLRSIKDDRAIVIPQGDGAISTMLYARYVENISPSVEILVPPSLHNGNRFRYLKTVMPSLDYSWPLVSTMLGFIKTNVDKVNIYSLGAPNYPIPDNVVASQSGMLFRFFPKDKLLDLVKWQENNEAILDSLDIPEKFHSNNLSITDRALSWYYIDTYRVAADICLNSSNYSCAIKYYSKALNIDPLIGEIRIRLADSLAKQGNCNYSENEYLKVIEKNGPFPKIYSKLADLATACFHDSARMTKYQDLRDRTLREQGASLEAF